MFNIRVNYKPNLRVRILLIGSHVDFLDILTLEKVLNILKFTKSL